MKKILLIDDQPEIGVLMKAVLSRSGYEVIIALNGNEGIQQAQLSQPDLILLDIMLPDISGFDVCRQLTQIQATSFIPVIMMTGRVTAQDLNRGFEEGAYDYLKKPVDRTELLARIKAALRFKEAREQMVESGKMQMFNATIVTTNHKIKQPLTLINLTMSAIKRLLKADTVDRDSVLKKVEIIEKGVMDIKDILNALNKIEKPELESYVQDIKMVQSDEEKTGENSTTE